MRILVTGGAGFIGSNLAHRFLAAGEEVTIFDNLSRLGTRKNLDWLKGDFGTRFEFMAGDVRDVDAVQQAVVGKDVVHHLASQVAVTTSVKEPRYDFEVNALGTLNVLEAARRQAQKPIVVFTSTNKVYGSAEGVPVIERATSYAYRDQPHGISESQPLDFHSPYACSKGAADQYVRDYARVYDLPTIVFRMSCIYGPRQFGTEDQGWVAHFIIAAVAGRPITIYGNGKQVRDILFVDDLVGAFELAVENVDTTRGQVYNIGGGPQNAVSIWMEFYPILRGLLGHDLKVSYSDWRPGDQLVYISDTHKAQSDFGWKPTVSATDGVACLIGWVTENRHLFV